MNRAAVDQAIALIDTVPGYASIARDLRNTPIVLAPLLPDRAQTSLLGHITLGPEPFASTGDPLFVSLAGTLIHEHCHTRQNPFQKTTSFWLGLITHTHPMRRYEAPAYGSQARFLGQLARSQTALAPRALQEQSDVRAAFATHYGQTRQTLANKHRP